MTPEKNDKKLTRWLLIATIALLVLVLCVQLWQLFGGKNTKGPTAPWSRIPPMARRLLPRPRNPRIPPRTASPPVRPP